MEYLPVPRAARWPHPRIPLLCDPDFEYPLGTVEFQEYPSLKGLDIGLYSRTLYIDSLLPDELQVQRLLATLQEWLFFGMLSEFAQQRIRPTKSVPDVEKPQHSKSTWSGRILHSLRMRATSADDIFVDGTAINQLITDYQARVRQRSLIENREHCQKLDNIFTQCRDVVEIIDLWCRDHGQRYPPAAAIVLAITCLGTTLEMTMHRSCSRLDILGTTTYWYPSFFARDRLAKDGWCPRLIQNLETALRPVEVYYASMLDRPYGSHSKCTKAECVAHDIDEFTYETKHLKSDCKCESISVDEQKLVAILDNGGIPVLETWMNSEGQITLTPVDSRERRVYVAISHVWSEGLGNPSRNSIPRCQLLKIQHLATAICEDLDGNIPFWIDTLSVPLEKRARSLAILRMKNTYEAAYRTMVLTKELDRMSGDISPLEFFMRLYCCPWSARLWTLQEGVLGKSLYFWVNRSTKSYEDMLQEFHHLLYEKASLPIGLNLHQQYQNWRELGVVNWQTADGRPDLVTKIAKLVNALRFRTTSKPEDEAICLGSLLNLNLTSVLESRVPAERMKQVWTLLGEVPTQLLFCAGPRIPSEPFHWAPMSIMGTAATVLNDGKRAIVRQDGLHITNPGWILLPGTHPIQGDFHFHEEAGDEYFTVFGDRRGLDRRGEPQPERIAIILSRELDDYKRKPQLSFDGIIVSVLSAESADQSTTILARYEERIRISPVTPDLWDERRRQEESDAKKLLQGQRTTRRYCLARTLASDQSWVIR